jgi:Domain of unknown function (DUF5658)
MTSKRLPVGRLLLYAALSVVDLVLTYRLLERGGGHVYEGNPVANAWLSAYGWTGLAWFKVGCMALVVGVAGVLCIWRPKTADRLLNFACAAVALVVIYSCSLVGFFGEGFPRTIGIRSLGEKATSSFAIRPEFGPSPMRSDGFYLKKGERIARGPLSLSGHASSPWPRHPAAKGASGEEVSLSSRSFPTN